MSQKYLSKVISKMHERLVKIIENNNYDLMSSEVQRYSQRMDRVMLRYLELDLSSSMSSLPEIDHDKKVI